jgi:protein TonB
VTVREDPWRRLPWLLPAAALLTLGLLLGFLRLLADGRDHRSPLPPPLDIGLVEMPAPAGEAAPAPEPPQPAPADVAPQPETPPPTPALETPPNPADAPAPAIPVAPPPPPPSEPKAAPKPPPKPTQRRVAPPAERTAPTAPPAAPAPPAQGTPPAANDSSPGLGNMGARALYKPLPEIPPALRRRALELVAVARFRVAADGSAAVELIEPTSDPELNRALLDTLKTWRFFPAMDHDRPVASSLDVRIPISVR